MREDIYLSNFTGGELSPRLKGRIDVEKYFNGCDTLLNMVPMPQGGATRRPGTLFVSTALSQVVANPIRLVPFIFSTLQAYMLEFAAGEVRVYMNDGLVMNGSSQVIVTGLPYQSADLPLLKFTQSDDTLYITHPGYPSATLTRSSHISWSYQAMTFRDGPYLSINTTTTTLTPSGTTGTITITASSVVGINATPQNTGQGFLATDVGRMIRIKDSAKWGWCLITAVTTTTTVTAVVQAAVANGADAALDGTSATVNWQLGKWWTGNYPMCVTFWQQRLMLLGTPNQPNALEGSVTADFTNFAPTADDGTVADNNALSFVISDDQVNAGHWLIAAGAAQMAQLAIGTTGGEEVMQPTSTTQALSSTNLQVYRETSLGSAPNVQPVRILKSVLFVDRPGRRMLDWQFQWQVNGYTAFDRTINAEHISRGGITQMAYQQSPHSIIWAIRADGTLIGLTYLLEQQVWGWHRHQLGGQYYGGPPIVESIAVIPSPDGSYDELWLSVLRTVNGTPTRMNEVMTRYFDAAPIEQSFFVDAGASSALTFPAATLTASAASGTGITFTAGAPVFTSASVGDLIRLNGGLAVVRGFTSTTHVVGDWYRAATSTAPAAANAWSCTPQSGSVSGLGYLAGESIALLGDGADLGTATAASTLALAESAALVTAGLPYVSQLITMPFEPARALATVTQGKAKRIDHLYLRLHESLGCNFGTRRTDPMTGVVADRLEPLETRSAADMMGQPPALFSGIRRLAAPGGYDQECQIEITTSGPLPLTVLALAAKANVGEMQ